MKIIAWNCRGLGNSPAVHGLLKCQKSEEPDILFLSETKMDERRMETIRVKLGMSKMEVVDCVGKGGGIAVLWRRGIDLVLRSKSKYHIDMEVLETGGSWWRFSGVYGEAHSERKHKTWEMMEELRLQQPQGIPWLCAGDFNEVLFHHEKEGGVPRAQSCLDRFKASLERCELHDLGFIGECSHGGTSS
jgi:exonuclease III